MRRSSCGSQAVRVGDHARRLGHAHAGPAPQRGHQAPVDPAIGTGIHAARLVQTSMGMSAGPFDTRELFHGRTLTLLKQVKLAFTLLCFVLRASCFVLRASCFVLRASCVRRCLRCGAWRVVARLGGCRGGWPCWSRPPAGRRTLVLLRPGEAPAEPVLPSRVLAAPSRRARSGVSLARARSTI